MSKGFERLPIGSGRSRSILTLMCMLYQGSCFFLIDPCRECVSSSSLDPAAEGIMDVGVCSYPELSFLSFQNNQYPHTGDTR